MKRGLRHGLALWMIAGACVAQAREYQDLFPTPRIYSMGHALTAFVDDYSALYSNPAGLALMENWELRLPQLATVAISPSILDIFNKIKGVSGGSNTSLVSALTSFDGKGACGGLELGAMGYFSKRLAVAVNPFSFNACFRVRTPSIFFAKMNVRMTADSGVSLGHAQSFLNNHVRLGIALRPFLVRMGMDELLENTRVLVLTKDPGGFLGAGWGFDFDVGAQANLTPIPMWGVAVKPMVGLVLQNGLGNKFSNPIQLSSSTPAAVPGLDRKVNLGLAASVESFGAFKPVVSFELRDLGVRTDSFWEHIASGFELSLKPRTWLQTALRGHFYKGNFGGGFGTKLSFFSFEMGTYSVNLGKGPGVGTDRRVYFDVSLFW